MDLLLLGLLVVAVLALPLWQARKQNKQLQQIRSMQDSVRVDDHVRTSAGLHGIVVGVDDDTVELEVSPDVVVTWDKMAIVQNVSAEGRESTPAGGVDSANDGDGSTAGDKSE